MKTRNNKLVSIIVVNFNNAMYLKKCLNSIINQTYKKKEIIVVDDQSNDHSLNVINKFRKKIIFLKTKQKSYVGSYDQINAYYTGFKKSKGEIISFIDSDDFFKKNKIQVIVNNFVNKFEAKLLFDLPILKYSKINKKLNFKQRSFFYTSWPKFPPQSCISLNREFAEEIFKKLSFKKFETIWFDFRIASYHFLKYGKLDIIDKYLTYYRQTHGSASKEYKFLSKNWWHRRKQAHSYMSYLRNKLKLNDPVNIDKFITSLIGKIK